MTTGSHAVQTQALGVRFGRYQALCDVTLAVPAGSVFALIGPNGAGKTTLIKTLLNLHRPTQGTANLLGRPSQAIRGRAFQEIGYVSENQQLPGWMTLEFFLDYLRPFYPTWDRALEVTLLDQLRLPRGQKLGRMSRGQQIKAALLGALAYRPSLLILDEPFSGLDPLARDEFIGSLLDRLAAEGSSMTVLLSSHDLAEIESFSTHIAYLNDGRLLFAEEIRSLTERFRDVTVTLNRAAMSRGPAIASQPVQTPPSWLLPERSAATFHFIHSQAARESVEQQIAVVLPGAGAAELAPMPLRSIFLALARSTSPSPVSAVGDNA